MLREPLPHRGALISLEQRGKARDFSCVYQASKYDLQGNPVAIASKGGIDGKGGMPRSFCIKDHGPCKLRVGEASGLVFGSSCNDVAVARRLPGRRDPAVRLPARRPRRAPHRSTADHGSDRAASKILGSSARRHRKFLCGP
jgi:phenylpropionate dioxygenase-like ring-hydroxylating dioxygenase large terminal subunit